MDRVEETMGDECLYPGHPSLLEALESGQDGSYEESHPASLIYWLVIQSMERNALSYTAFDSYQGSKGKEGSVLSVKVILVRKLT